MLRKITFEIHMIRPRILNSRPGPLLHHLLTYHSFQLEEQRNAKNVPTFSFKSALRFKKVPLTTNVKISLRARFCSPAIIVTLIFFIIRNVLTFIFCIVICRRNVNADFDKRFHSSRITILRAFAAPCMRNWQTIALASFHLSQYLRRLARN